MAYTIMIVDDSETIRAVLVRSLAMTKLPIDSVVQAIHGKDALEKLKTAYVDIVFTDINMPEMDGITLFETMNANPEYKDIPVVVVSTEGSSTRIAELRQKGIKGYLRKPFTPEKLRDVIVETLGAWDA
jgi:two-component system, chemotaxis family, chemotaxis protein CheY